MSEEEKERLARLSDEDIRAMKDLARMYQAGRAAIFKAVLYAITGAVVTGIGYGLKHCVQSIVNN